MRSRALAIALLILCCVLIGAQVSVIEPIKNIWFDNYQRLMPRMTTSQDVVIVAIDDVTLAQIGQWPWPRNVTAALIDQIASYQPKVIGLDIIFAEPDHGSPEALAQFRPDLPEEVRKSLSEAQTNDETLAMAIHRGNVVLGAAGFIDQSSHTLEGLRVQPIALEAKASQRLVQYPFVLASLPMLQAAATSQALLSTNSENGLIRRSPLLSRVNDTVVPNLSLELLRISKNAKEVLPITHHQTLQALQVGALRIPVAINADAWIHYDTKPGGSIISALNVFQGNIAAEQLQGKIVLVGLTGLGLSDWITTTRDERRPGVEVHAQLMQAFLDGDFVTRPNVMPWFEVIALFLAGLSLVGCVPILRPQRSVWLWLGLVIFTFALSLLLFKYKGLLFDAININISLSMVFVCLLINVLAESQRQRKLISQTLQKEREQAAKVAGELESARRIQLNSLPDAHIVFANEKRFSIATYLEPAREIGGDLYDCFMLDDQHVFIAVGDVSGKGVPASLFMAVTRALAKSLALRGNQNLAGVMRATNAELARDNPEMLFVTMVAAVLNVKNGQLTLCNAGHEAPWRWSTNGEIQRLKGESGPPLCMLDDYMFTTQNYQLNKGDRILLLSDGVTEAMDINESLYGADRVNTLMSTLKNDTDVESLKQAMCNDIATFVGNAAQSDDITFLTLQWTG